MNTAHYVSSNFYSENLSKFHRRISREVFIGDVPMGGTHPIRIQSMTTTDTMDTEATIAQSIRMIEAGCDYVRITAPSLKEAENLRNIKEGLHKLGYKTPLIADIHFTPNAAELAARIVEKVRINPGNYIDKKKFELKEYTDLEYTAEIHRIRKRFEPLVKICKEYGTAMRIGTNHGSLSDRIMNRYGDTPMGMVESAMEFLRICEDLDYHNIVLSMKASNPIVMIQAYRLLVRRMNDEGMNYPLHLGVTEAGEGEEGRIKSAMGIGALLAEGLGDTVRVSLTEEPEYEVPVARDLVARFEKMENTSVNDFGLSEFIFPPAYSSYEYSRRRSKKTYNFGGRQVPRVILDMSKISEINPLNLKVADFHYNAISDKWNMGEQGADYLYFKNRVPDFMLPNGTKGLYEYETWQNLEDKENNLPIIALENIAHKEAAVLRFISADAEHLTTEKFHQLKSEKDIVLLLSTSSKAKIASLKQVFFQLQHMNIEVPVVLDLRYEQLSEEEFLLAVSTDAGALLADGFGDGIFVQYESKADEIEKATLINRTSFYILQASRTRISKTEYISCPSCGRTLFNLQATTAMIRKETDHLKGVKIAIMGCIVNGPGEMADADYGYVGTGPGKISLYRGKEVVKRNITSDKALSELIELIRQDGKWIEKEELAGV